MKNLSDQGYGIIAQEYENYMLLKNYSQATIKTYMSNYRLYNQWCDLEGVHEIYTQEQVREYLLYRLKNGAKWQTMNNIYSAMRKLFREVLEIEWSFKKLPRPRKERTLPELISRKEVQRLIKGCGNLKHKAILVTIYSAGLRAGELRNLKITDIDSERLQLRIRKGKGSKDRYVQIPIELIYYLRKYYLKYRPENYLFYGRKKEGQISFSAIRWAIRQSKKRQGLRKKISPHTLRHCYATHHLETGTDLVFLQNNMGHKHIKTTARYIHLCKERYQHIYHPIVDIIAGL